MLLIVVAAAAQDVAPLPPSNLVVVDTPNDDGVGLDITFDRSPDDGAGANDVTFYRVYKRLAGQPQTLVGQVVASGVASYAYTVRGLTAWTRYGIAVYAFDGALFSTGALVWQTVVDNTPPGPPSNLALADVPGDNGAALRLTFNASAQDVPADPEASAYHIYRSTVASAAGSKVGEVPATQAATYEYIDSGLVPGRIYYYRIKTTGNSGTSGFSAQASGTPTDNLAPQPPSSLTITDPPADSGTTLQLTIGASPDDGSGANDVTQYIIYRRSPGTKYTELATLPATGSATYGYLATGLRRGTLYYFGVRAKDSALVSTMVTSSATPQDTVAPAPPRNVALVNPTNDTGETMRLNWTRSVDDSPAGDVTHYRLYLKDGGTTTRVGQLPATKAETYTYLFKNLVPGRRYQFGVSAYDGANQSPVVWLWGDSLPPGPPQNVRVVDVPNDDGRAIRIEFDRSVDDGGGENDVVNYRIYWRTGDAAYTLLKTITATKSASYNFTKSGLTRNVRVTVRVTAFDGVQESSGATASGTPLDNIPPASPRDVALVNPTNDSGETMRLNFSRSLDDSPTGDVTHYRFYLKDGGTTTRVGQFAATQAETYTYLFKNLVPGRLYQFGVCAYDGTNQSAVVWVTGDSLPPGPPQNLRLVDVPNDDGVAITVQFDRSADDGLGSDDVVYYRIFWRQGSGEYTLLKTISANNSPSYAYTKGGLTRNQLITVRVVAFDGYQESAAATASGTPADNTPPAPPRNLTVEDWPDDDGTSLLVKFRHSLDDLASDPEVTRYDIYRATSGTGAGSKVGSVTANRSVDYEYRSTGLTPGTMYWHWAVAVAPTGESVPSNKASLAPLDERPVRPPSNLTAEDRPYDTGGIIDLRWNRSADDGAGFNHVTRYHIYRRMANVVTDPVRIATVNATGASSYTWADTTVPMELILYEYTVTAASASGVESTPAGPVRAASENNNVVVFQPPSNLTAADRPGDQGGAIILTWYRSPSESDIGPPPPPPVVFSAGVDTQGGYGGQYEFYRRTGGGSYGTTPTFVVDAAGTGDPMSYVNTGLTNGTTYYYKVRYRRYNQISNFTAEASAVPQVGGAAAAATADAEADEPEAVAPGAEDPSASAPATADDPAGLSVRLVSPPSRTALGKNATVGAAVTASGPATVCLEYTVNGSSPMRTPATSGRDAFSASFTLPTGQMAAGTVLQVRAMAVAGGATAVSNVAVVVVGG